MSIVPFLWLLVLRSFFPFLDILLPLSSFLRRIHREKRSSSRTVHVLLWMTKGIEGYDKSIYCREWCRENLSEGESLDSILRVLKAGLTAEEAASSSLLLLFSIGESVDLCCSWCVTTCVFLSIVSYSPSLKSGKWSRIWRHISSRKKRQRRDVRLRLPSVTQFAFSSFLPVNE
jgi:hypothetical protein